MMLVALGGALGAVGRYLIGNWLPSEAFPWGTLTVNLVGSLLLGALACAVTVHGLMSEDAMLFLGVGILGAFTTLSTYSVDTIRLYEAGTWTPLAGYVLATAVVGPLLALAGWKAASAALA